MTTIRFTHEETIEGILYKVEIKGTHWAGEYEVDIHVYESRGYSWTRVGGEYGVTCKRITTINKKLAAYGFTCKMEA